jgi:hypothetical protein
VQALRTEVGLLDAGKITTVNVKRYWLLSAGLIFNESLLIYELTI